MEKRQPPSFHLDELRQKFALQFELVKSFSPQGATPDPKRFQKEYNAFVDMYVDGVLETKARGLDDSVVDVFPALQQGAGGGLLRALFSDVVKEFYNRMPSPADMLEKKPSFDLEEFERELKVRFQTIMQLAPGGQRAPSGKYRTAVQKLVDYYYTGLKSAVTAGVDVRAAVRALPALEQGYDVGHMRALFEFFAQRVFEEPR